MKTNCCNTQEKNSLNHDSHCRKYKFDYLLWGGLFGVVIFYFLYLFNFDLIKDTEWLHTLCRSIYDMVNTMWWGVLLGILMVCILSKVPREFISFILGSKGGIYGIIRASLAGVLLDLCNHGILMVGAQLYNKGASNGQVMSFLIASPWNSFSLTMILITLIGWMWTLLFIGLSFVIAIITGLLFESFTKRGILPENSNTVKLPDNFKFWKEAKRGLKRTQYTPSFFKSLVISGIEESRIVLRWLLFGILLSAIIKVTVDTGTFQSYFGPSIAGLVLTLFFATIIEVCSEGSAPIAADMLTRAKSPGNTFSFLMAGVCTDYTEMVVLKDTTKSWKIALFLPLITLPQVIFIGCIINLMTNTG